MGQPSAGLPTRPARAAAPSLPAARPPGPPGSFASAAAVRALEVDTAPPVLAPREERPAAVSLPPGAGPLSAGPAPGRPAVRRVTRRSAIAGTAGDAR